MDWSDPKAVTEVAFRIYPYAAEIVRNGTIDEERLYSPHPMTRC
jgi:hypothetical protein